MRLLDAVFKEGVPYAHEAVADAAIVSMVFVIAWVFSYLTDEWPEPAFWCSWSGAFPWWLGSLSWSHPERSRREHLSAQRWSKGAACVLLRGFEAVLAAPTRQVTRRARRRARPRFYGV